MDKTLAFEKDLSYNSALIFFNKDGYLFTHKLSSYTKIGRNVPGSDSNVKLDSPLVSRNHGEITVAGNQYIYKDCNSTNGTIVDNVFYGKNTPEKGCPLKDGTILQIDAFNNTSHPEAVFALFAEYYNPDSVWHSLKLTEDILEVSVGRGDSSGLKFSENTVSQKHASFFSSKNGWAIIDHDSTNGVYLNGKKLSFPRYLNKFDVIRIADIYFIFKEDKLIFSSGSLNIPENINNALKMNPVQNEVFVNETAVKPPVITPVAQVPAMAPVAQPPVFQPVNKPQLIINITERSVFQRFKKMTLLQDINLSVSDGDMVLILGGSGAGKTTFINAVMGYEKADGKILYKDTDIYEEYERMKYEIGFVPQQDLLRGSDTVYDTLSNSAEMKLPKSVSLEEREFRINKVLDELGLSREKNSLVSKLSGGQRKRLSIAVEFIANPSLFFLDEPDSGVDDIMGRGLMENLRAIANQGKIVMVITHSPERAADLFDKVIVLAKSTKDNCGHLAFYGDVKEAFDFFEVKSFREIVKKINRPDENGEGLSDFFIDKFRGVLK